MAGAAAGAAVSPRTPRSRANSLSLNRDSPALAAMNAATSKAAAAAPGASGAAAAGAAGAAVGRDGKPLAEPRGIHEHLASFTRPEEMGSACGIVCAKCKCVRAFTKQLSLRVLPNVLVLHLKRFDAMLQRKIGLHVAFPLELDMSRYVHETARPPTSEPAMYDLYAVINHHGTMNAGHYTAFTRLAGNWFKCDDQWVIRASEAEVLSSQGCVHAPARPDLLIMHALRIACVHACPRACLPASLPPPPTHRRPRCDRLPRTRGVLVAR